ncbi:MAG: threonylcarbamoyl-AMP synthase [Clostridiales bacterium]|nr:threonylcarbamoyl-AMP synthase [Clostridiales bacterium]
MDIEVNTVETKLTDIDAASLEEAGEIIRAGGLVAFPTETVYGLGADAMNGAAAARIYEAKGRPSDNPLIVHIADMEQLDLVARDIPKPARQIMEAFWPGPLTVILHKKEEVPDGTTGGLQTVAVRMPSHPTAQALIRESGRVIAAPSANTSGRPSPTMAEHVLEDMDGRIPLILDGGPVGIGIESTIVDMTGEVPMILRPGYITKSMLEDVVGTVQVDPAVSGRTMQKDIVAKAPGMKYRHYAPKGQLILVEGPRNAVVDKINSLAEEKMQQGYHVGILATDEGMADYRVGYRMSIGSRERPDSIAANLYKVLRECDEQKLDYIYSESFFEEGLGNAIMNRMLKAAGYHLISL